MLYVNCRCGEQHYPKQIEVTNIEEDIFGRDVLYYICPNLNEEVSAYVLSNGIPDE